MKDKRLMRKMKALLAVAFIVAGQFPASAAGITRDSAKIVQHYQTDELLSTLEPTYLKEPVIGSPWSRNWFASISAGTSVFAGSPLGCEDIFGRMQPALQVSAGKWFTPSIGVRASYQGFGLKFIDANIAKQRYHAAHAELLWNVVGVNPSDELGLHHWTVAPYLGGGIIKHEGNGKHPFTVNYGVMAAYRLGRRLSVNMELAGLNTFQDFDGQGNSKRFGDQLFTLSAGLTVNIGKVGWKRTVDANPYRQQNEYLMETINDLLHQRGLPSDSFDNTNTKHGEYSGLASLRARLAHKDWNGKDSIAGQTSEDHKLIGVPFYFFFRINTCTLTDESQLQNLINLAKVAKAYNLDVYVDGAADAATGTEPINEKLSEQRASYIARLLREQGVSNDAIHCTAKGGINKFTPVQRNRHTRVMIKSSK